MALQPEFREDWGDGDVQPITRVQGTYSRMALFQPGHAGRSQPSAVPIVYKWEDAAQALESLAASGADDPYDGCLIEYCNPMTSGPTVPTMSARLHLLRPGQETRLHRHTSTVRHVVVQGSGVTTVDAPDATELRWTERDAFTIPSWRWHRHQNSSRTEAAIIFSVTDQPAYEALGFYREEGQ
jgi:gentisate 1,2-dioxygenase